LLIALIAVLTLLGANAFGNVIRQWFDALAHRITLQTT
jgi:Flp pilus assembly pilin Flp